MIDNTQTRLQKELERRGRFTLAVGMEYPIGAIIGEFEDLGGTVIPGPVVIVAVSNREKYMNEMRRLGLVGSLPPGIDYFYEVAAE